MSIFRFERCWQSQGQGGYYYAALVDVDRNAKGHIEVPAQTEIGGTVYAVERIREKSFKGCIYVTSVYCPDSIRIIGKRGDANDTSAYLSHAFNCCCRLVCVSIPNTVTFIGMASFEGCPHLRHFVVRNVQAKSKISGWTMTKEDFERCTLYTNANDIINNKIVDVFGAKKSVAELPPQEEMLKELETIPQPTIKHLRFSKYTAHYTGGGVYYGAQQHWDDASVFGNGDVDEDVVIPEVIFINDKNEFSLEPKAWFSPYIVSRIGSNAFRGYNKLKAIYLPDTIKEMGWRDHCVDSLYGEKFQNSDCFDSCSNLETINMPDRVSFIGTSPFSNCINLKKIVVRNTGIKKMAVSTWRLNKTECQNIEVLTSPKYVSQVEKLNVFKCVTGCDTTQILTIKAVLQPKQEPSAAIVVTETNVESPQQTPAANNAVAEKEIAELKRQLAQQQEEIAELKNQLAKKDEEIAELKQQSESKKASAEPKPQPAPAQPKPIQPSAPTSPTAAVPKANGVFKLADYKSKGKLCHTIVKTYVEQHPDVTLAQLKQAFNVPKCEVVESLAVALTIKDSTGKVGGDYYIKENDQLKAKDGMVVVWSYWPERFYNPFMEQVKTLGYTIE